MEMTHHVIVYAGVHLRLSFGFIYRFCGFLRYAVELLEPMRLDGDIPAALVGTYVPNELDYY
jgi:hypothetical protein